MAYILTRVDKGTPLTYHEVDSNFTNLNDGKLERAAISSVTGTITSSATTSTITSVSVDTLAVGMIVVKTAGTGALGTDSVITDVDPTNNTITVVGSTSHTAGSVTLTARPALSGGFIDGTPIGATTASTGKFTTIEASSDVTITGNLTVNGTTTNINTTNLVIEDKNIILGDVTTPSNTTADGGGITLKGLTDKTLNWVNSTSAWTSSEDFNLLTGKVYEINGTTVLSGSTLGSGVTASSLTSVGTIATGTWSATEIAVNRGGTGQTTYTNGQLLIGNTTGNTLAKATLTGTTDQITVTNGAGSITLSTPQSIATTSTVQFGNIGVGVSPTAALHLKAGTASANTAPIKVNSGTNLSSIEQGAVEFNGSTFFTSPQSTYRGLVPAVTFTSGLSASNGVTIAAATNYVLFPTANDTITLPIGLYRFELVFRADTTAAVANIPSWSPIGIGNAAGTTSWQSQSVLTTGATATSIISAQGINAATATAFAPTTSAAATRVIQIRGLLRITTAGTIIPAIQYSGLAGTLTTYADNYIMITPIATGTGTGSTATVGWA
jgi:hypothetical protein